MAIDILAHVASTSAADSDYEDLVAPPARRYEYVDVYKTAKEVDANCAYMQGHQYRLRIMLGLTVPTLQRCSQYLMLHY